MARASVFANWRVQIENTKNISNVHVGSMTWSTSWDVANFIKWFRNAKLMNNHWMKSNSIWEYLNEIASCRVSR